MSGEMQQFPSLTTQETQRLRSDYPSIEHLEAGNVAAWLVERQEQLLVRAKDERTGMNLAKLLTLASGAVGAVCYATSPLAPIGAMIAGVGYIWAVAQDMNSSHTFAPVPFVRGNFIEFLSAMGEREARVEWFASQNELVDLMFHLDSLERYEFGMLKEHVHVLSEYLVTVEPGKRFYAYRWLLDWFINLKGIFPSQEKLSQHLATVTLDPRVNYQQVTAIQQHQAGIPEPRIADLPEPKFASLPSHEEADLPSPTIEAIAQVITEQPVSECDKQTDSPSVVGESPTTVNQSPLTLIQSLKEEPGFAIGFIRNLARSPLSKIFGAVPGSGKTTMQRALIKEVVQQFPNAQIYVTQTKRDPFLGLETIPNAVIFSAPRRDDGEPILNQADRVSRILEYRSQFPASEAKRLFRDKPVILLLCDYSDSIKQCSAEVKAELLKIVQQVFFNGRALNVQVWLDVQVLNLLAALGLDGSDSRSAAILICLGAERVEEGGDFGVIENAITGSSETFPNGFKAKIKPHLEQFKARSRVTKRTLAITPFMDAGAFLLPDWSPLEDEILPDALLWQLEQNIQKQKADLRVKLDNLIDFIQEPKPKKLNSDSDKASNTGASDKTVANFKVSDDLAEPLKTIWLFCKEQNKWVTTREVYQKSFAILKGKSVKNIRQYLGLLADTGYGEIDEKDGDKDKSDSAVAFRAY